MHRRIAAAFGATLLSLSVCSDDAASNPTGSLLGDASGKAAKVNVFVAASLEESFGEMEKKFESAHPDVDLAFNFAGSQELAEQINSGAPADVVTAVNTTMMGALKSGDKVADTKIFASNTLVLITSKENPARVTGLNPSLDKVKLVICTPKAPADGKTAPCGTAAAELVGKLDVKLNLVSEEQKVTDVRSKATPDEADTGIVYRTDAVAGGKEVETIETPGVDTIVNDYPVGMAKAFKNSSKAKAFTEYATSWERQATLKKHGFNRVRADGC